MKTRLQLHSLQGLVFLAVSGICSAAAMDSYRDSALRGQFTAEKGYTGDLTLFARPSEITGVRRVNPNSSKTILFNPPTTPVKISVGDFRFDSRIPATDLLLKNAPVPAAVKSRSL